ncbi:MAG: nicotinate-nucleotide--dimethylbenzimidazole phosphoribosyltransferase [Spirochaetaceae bacterium]|nr:nicotinate-nucleotide--dimethylbenzimidazole phosphoribosyltransferase [Spirochaetaceae bacterium]
MTENAEYREFFSQIKKNWDAVAKPLDSLGKFETIVAKIGAAQKTLHPKADKSACIVFCADNGIVEEGVSQSDKSVTKICAENIAAEKTAVGIMARRSNTEILAVDIGIDSDEAPHGLLDRKIRKGTRNFLKESAMTLDETEQALQTGIELVRRCKERGYEILCIGEMGIGNTTTSAAVASLLLDKDAAETAGRGAGLSNQGIARKINVIQQAIEKYAPFRDEPLKVLASVGGFDIAGMTGVCLGAKQFAMPVVLDGVISMVAALVAESLEKGVTDYLIPSHKSREPAAALIMQELEIDAPLDADMALGEGSGAVLMLGILQTIIDVYEKSLRFGVSGSGVSSIEQYTRFGA